MLRMRAVGQLHDGTGAPPVILDLMIKNTSFYMPWSSESTGRGVDNPFPLISLAADQEATFQFRLIANNFDCQAGAGCDPPAVVVPYAYDFCFFDFDTACPMEPCPDPSVLVEQVTTCGIDSSTSYGGYFMNGRLPSSARPVSQYLCDNMDTSEYMDVTTGDFGDGADCVSVVAKKGGRGADNPRSLSDVLGTCEGTPPHKFVCVTYPANTGEFEVAFKVGPNPGSDPAYGRSLLFAGTGLPTGTSCSTAPPGPDCSGCNPSTGFSCSAMYDPVQCLATFPDTPVGHCNSAHEKTPEQACADYRAVCQSNYGHDGCGCGSC